MIVRSCGYIEAQGRRVCPQTRSMIIAELINREYDSSADHDTFSSVETLNSIDSSILTCSNDGLKPSSLQRHARKRRHTTGRELFYWMLAFAAAILLGNVFVQFWVISENSFSFAALSRNGISYPTQRIVENFSKEQDRSVIDSRIRKDLESKRQSELDMIRRTTKEESTGFTVRLSSSERVNGMVRTDLILAAINSLLVCNGVERIEIDEDSDRMWLDHPSGKVVLFESTSREVTSKAVLLLDSNIVLSCQDLERGFQIWVTSPDRAVGYFPYIHHHMNSATNHESKPDDLISMMYSEKTTYSLISDHALFIHRRYLDSEFLSIARQEGNGRPCETFLLSIVSTFTSLKPPMRVFGRPSDLRSSSNDPSDSDHDIWKCLEDVMDELGLIDLPIQSRTFLGRIM